MQLRSTKIRVQSCIGQKSPHTAMRSLCWSYVLCCVRAETVNALNDGGIQGRRDLVHHQDLALSKLLPLCECVQPAPGRRMAFIRLNDLHDIITLWNDVWAAQLRNYPSACLKFISHQRHSASLRTRTHQLDQHQGDKPGCHQRGRRGVSVSSGSVSPAASASPLCLPSPDCNRRQLAARRSWREFQRQGRRLPSASRPIASRHRAILALIDDSGGAAASRSDEFH